MKKSIILAIALFFIAIGQANATTTLDITTDYEAGDETVTYYLTLTSDSYFTVKAMYFGFDYDQSELDYETYENNYSSVFGSDYTGYYFMKPYSADETEGIINNFYIGANMGVSEYTVLVDGTYVLGSFTFSVSEDATIDTITDFFMLNGSSTLYYWLYECDENGTMTIEYKEGDISDEILLGNAFNYTSDVGTVPLPTTSWLLGSGIIGLVGLRRKNAAR